MTFVITYGVEVKAQTPIRFAKGRSSATVSGNTGSYGVTYVIRAKAGQLLTLDLSPSAKVGIKVGNDGIDGQKFLLRERHGGTYEIGLEEGGDYTIFIGSTNQQPMPFRLTVKVRKMKDI